MISFEVQVIARAWVSLRVVVDATNSTEAAKKAITVAQVTPQEWQVAGAKNYVGVWMDPQELSDFSTDEITEED